MNVGFLFSGHFGEGKGVESPWFKGAKSASVHSDPDPLILA